MKREQVSEQELGAVVVGWLEALGADVYQEVECRGGVADIVARVSAELWIVEVKTSFSIALLAQAMERRREAHRVYIAAPYSRRIHRELFDELGIGVLEVHVGREHSNSGNGYGNPSVREIVRSRRWNTRPVALANDLKPEHKTHGKAGAVGGGGRWTPFRDTCEQLARIVSAEPGIALKSAIDKIRHHYSSPKSARVSLADWIEKGKVAGVRSQRSHGSHGAITLHPVGGAS